MRADPDHARRLRALFERGEACAFEVQGRRQGGGWSPSRAARPAPWPGCGSRRPPARTPACRPRRASPPSSNARPTPAWIAAADGSPVWVNAAWLKAVGRRQPGRGRRPRRWPSTAPPTRWPARPPTSASGARRCAGPPSPASAAPSTSPPSRWRAAASASGPRTSPSRRTCARLLKRNVEAHDETLNHIAEAVAVFDRGQEADVPQHRLRRAVGPGAGLAGRAAQPRRGARPPAPAPPPAGDRRLRQVEGRASWTATSSWPAAPDEMWSLPDGRTLQGGAPAAPDGRPPAAVLRHHRRAEADKPVQRPDPGAAGDARQALRRGRGVRLRRAAAAAQRGLRAASGTSRPAQVEAAGDFEGVVELCMPRAARPELLARAEGPRRRPRPAGPRADHRRGEDLRQPHRRLPVAAAAGRRDPDRLHRRHRRPQAGGRAARPRSRRWPRPSG